MADIPGSASGVIILLRSRLLMDSESSSAAAAELEEELPLRDGPETAHVGASLGGWLCEGVESTLLFKAYLAELGVFFSVFSARLSSFLIKLYEKYSSIAIAYNGYRYTILPFERHWCLWRLTTLSDSDELSSVM